MSVDEVMMISIAEALMVAEYVADGWIKKKSGFLI